jgi:hypothetical protein
LKIVARSNHHYFHFHSFDYEKEGGTSYCRYVKNYKIMICNTEKKSEKNKQPLEFGIVLNQDKL